METLGTTEATAQRRHDAGLAIMWHQNRQSKDTTNICFPPSFFLVSESLAPARRGFS